MDRQMANTDAWTFLHVNDSHMGTPRSYRFRPAINQRWAAIKRQIAATKADLLLHGGDLTRDRLAARGAILAVVGAVAGPAAVKTPRRNDALLAFHGTPKRTGLGHHQPG